MPVAVHGVEEETVCDFAPAPCTPLPGQRACAHRWWLAAASGIHHCPSFVSFESNGCKVNVLRGQAGKQVRFNSPKKSTGRGAGVARGRPPAPRGCEPSARGGSSCGERAELQMELSDSISTGWFPFYCFTGLFLAGTKGVHRKA